MRNADFGFRTVFAFQSAIRIPQFEKRYLRVSFNAAIEPLDVRLVVEEVCGDAYAFWFFRHDDAAPCQLRNDSFRALSRDERLA